MNQSIKIARSVRLDDFDPAFSHDLSKNASREKTKEQCLSIRELEKLLNAYASHSLIILLQGMVTVTHYTGGTQMASRLLHRPNRLACTEKPKLKWPKPKEDLSKIKIV